MSHRNSGAGGAVKGRLARPPLLESSRVTCTKSVSFPAPTSPAPWGRDWFLSQTHGGRKKQEPHPAGHLGVCTSQKEMLGTWSSDRHANTQNQPLLAAPLNTTCSPPGTLARHVNANPGTFQNTSSCVHTCALTLSHHIHIFMPTLMHLHSHTWTPTSAHLGTHTCVVTCSCTHIPMHSCVLALTTHVLAFTYANTHTCALAHQVAHSYSLTQALALTCNTYTLTHSLTHRNRQLLSGGQEQGLAGRGHNRTPARLSPQAPQPARPLPSSTGGSLTLQLPPGPPELRSCACPLQPTSQSPQTPPAPPGPTAPPSTTMTLPPS